MAQQSFIWTALPNGYTSDGQSLRISVIISPRLDAKDQAQKLSTFPDWIDWPATLKKATFEIHYGDDPENKVTIQANQITGSNRVDTSLGSAESSKWHALFNEDVFVAGYQYNIFQYDGQNHVVSAPERVPNCIVSYPIMEIAKKVEDLYKTLSSKVSTMPKVSEILDDRNWSELVNYIRDIDSLTFSNGVRNPHDLFRYYLRSGKMTNENQLKRTLAQFQIFHTPPMAQKIVSMARNDDSRIRAKWLEFSRPDMLAPEKIAKQLDFHQILAAMNQYPTILRLLGIVVDFTVAANSFHSSADSPLYIKVNFPPEALHVQDTIQVSLVTHTFLSPDKFQAVSKVSNPTLHPQQSGCHIIDGLLDMYQNHEYDILQFDPDGAGLKLINFARTLARLSQQRVDNITRIEKDIGVPSLRGAGIMIVRNNRRDMLEDNLNENTNRNDALNRILEVQSSVVPIDLWAEDLVLGYRIDIWDSKTSMWHSLCQRIARYELNESEVVPKSPLKGIVEEGTVRLAVTKSVDSPSNDPSSQDDNTNLIYLHEAVVSWTGWSLVSPSPGLVIGKDDSATSSEAKIPPGLKFKTTFKALPGSLPRLRFGRKYWIRARVVDLAGNSLPPQQQDFGVEESKKNARLYCRYEPLAAPIIALVKQPGGITEKPAEGESMEHIVIRSFNDTVADNTVPTTQIAHRFAVPPQSSIKDAEMHGALDSGGKLDKSKFDLLANQKDLDATNPNAALQEEKIASNDSVTTFAVYNDGAALTYLPDPMPTEVAVRIFDHPNMTDDINPQITIKLYPTGSWPDAQPFKIRVFEPTSDLAAKPFFDEETRILLMPLPKAVRAKIRLSMMVPKEWLDSMGVWYWLSEEDKKNLRLMSLYGQNWMLTPWRTLEVVHAVQRPLVNPQMSKLVVSRDYGSTWATPEFEAICSLKSTDRIDLCAEWHEPKYDPTHCVVDSKRSDVAFSVKTTDGKSYATRISGEKFGGLADFMIIDDEKDLISVNMIKSNLTQQKNHEFHDTRYRRIEYWLEGTTNFASICHQVLFTRLTAAVI